MNILPNIGFGLYLYSLKWYFGISIPKMIENDIYNMSIVAHEHHLNPFLMNSKEKKKKNIGNSWNKMENLKEYVNLDQLYNFLLSFTNMF